MALDGITISNIVSELNSKLLGGRVDKIYQPRADEVIMAVRSLGANTKLLLSANSSHPRLHLTDLQKDNPMSPPMFCMVLRKHLSGGKILKISQPNFERIVILEIESLSEMGDKTVKKLIIEIMGKHSNIILTDYDNKILDAAKHISHEKSSVREVLPGKDYIFPPSQNKENPLELNEDTFLQKATSFMGRTLTELIYKCYTGISPIMAAEICSRANLDASSPIAAVSAEQLKLLFTSFHAAMDEVKKEAFSPEIVYDPKTKQVLDFSSLSMRQFETFPKKHYDAVSALLETFYAEKDNVYYIAQKAHDIRRLILTNIERCVKKKEIQNKTLKDIADREKWRLKGELITANIYAVQKGMTKFMAPNFYEEDMPEVEILLDPTKTPSENAQRYFNKYNKAKRTLAALDIQIKQNEEELNYLESVLSALSASSETADIEEIRAELIEQGYMKRKNTQKNKGQKAKKSKPLHYISSQGYDIFVGKSNYQNDELTLRTADKNDIWLHTKDIPGSHVIICTNGAGTVPEETLSEAANLSAFYSKAKNSSNVPVDYALKKFVKKPSGAKPGMVIYVNNKTLYITPKEQDIESMEKKSE